MSEETTIFITYKKIRCVECRHEFEYSPIDREPDPDSDPKFCPECGKRNQCRTVPAPEVVPDPPEQVPEF